MITAKFGKKEIGMERKFKENRFLYLFCYEKKFRARCRAMT